MAKIFIYDEFSPEDTAMMQALYSRSPLSVVQHADKVKQTGSGKFMEQFYVGYGHLSIADCGSTTIFLEGVSLLADKAIQDWPLYSGQETSTRYIDMSKQAIIDPVGSSASKKILDRWMNFYIDNQREEIAHLKNIFPTKKGENEMTYDKAIKARCFDSLRAFLPAGITTQLSWHTNLRQAWDKLCVLRYNPLEEVRELARKILKNLKEKYPNSFSHNHHQESENYRQYATEKHNFFNPPKYADFSCRTNINKKELSAFNDLISKRPPKTNLPHFLSGLGNIQFNFLLDFGSFRDIQRHRNGVCRMPLLTVKKGFNSWYLEQLPSDLRVKAEKLIKEQIPAINRLKTTLENTQYYISLGFNVACQVTYGLPASAYVVELRSGKAVHPTLRKIAHKMHHALKEEFPKLALHCDLDLDDWDVRRGLHDIIKK